MHREAGVEAAGDCRLCIKSPVRNLTRGSLGFFLSYFDDFSRPDSRMLRIKTPSCTVLQGGPLSARLPASRVPSKNFLATHQLDVHFCIEFLCTWYPQHCPSRVVCRKRALTLRVRPRRA